MRSMPESRWYTLMMLAISISACHRQAPAPAAVPQPATIDSAAIARSRAEAAARVAAARRDSMSRAARADSIRLAEATRRAVEARRDLIAPLHFDFDRSELLEGERALLDRKAVILLASPEVEVSISGNTDERGSDEYNIALGMRRAIAVMRYLVDRGIASRRISTASNGEERPICQQHDESCWSQNRRAEFAITRGAETIAQR